MSATQVRALCLCNVVIFIGIAAIVGVMPVYLAQLRAGATITGLFLAFAYLCLALGTVLAGCLADRLQRRKTVLLVSGACAAPLTWLLGTITAVLPLLVVVGCLWFVTGTAMALVPILTGLCAPPTERGRLFGRLTLSSGLGLLLGNLLSGPIVDRWGYPALFVVLGLVALGLPGASALAPDPGATPAPPAHVTRRTGAILTQRPFLLLVGASILGQAANIVIVLGRVLLMHTLHFPTTAITIVAALGGVVTLPLPLLCGRMADRLGPKPVLIACFAGPPLGLLALASAQALWQFWVASALQTVLGASLVVGSALVSALVPAERRGTALALLNATPWIGIVVGLSGGGLAISLVQMRSTVLVSVLLSLVALVALLPISTRQPPRSATQPHDGAKAQAARSWQ